MKQELIEKFNAVTDETVEDYCKAKDGGFCWLWFLERARLKIMESGYLPQRGTALIDARYNNSADAVLNGLLCAARPSVYFVFVSITLRGGSWRILLWFMSDSVLPMFSSKNFIVFRSYI